MPVYFDLDYTFKLMKERDCRQKQGGTEKEEDKEDDSNRDSGTNTDRADKDKSEKVTRFEFTQGSGQDTGRGESRIPTPCQHLRENVFDKLTPG